jgi:hypothetical protein
MLFRAKAPHYKGSGRFQPLFIMVPFMATLHNILCGIENILAHRQMELLDNRGIDLAKIGNNWQQSTTNKRLHGY